MKKKEEIKEEKIEAKEVKNNNKKNNNTWVIVICIIAGLFTVFIPIILFISMMLVISFDESFDLEYDSDYHIVNNTAIFEDERAVIKDLNGSFNGENKYIVTGYIDNKDASFLELNVDLYDSNNYIIGQKNVILNLSKNKNYKFKIEYDDFDASEVVNFKVSKIICY